jgi:hypothetical protein
VLDKLKTLNKLSKEQKSPHLDGIFCSLLKFFLKLVKHQEGAEQEIKLVKHRKGARQEGKRKFIEVIDVKKSYQSKVLNY